MGPLLDVATIREKRFIRYSLFLHEIGCVVILGLNKCIGFLLFDIVALLSAFIAGLDVSLVIDHGFSLNYFI